MPTPAGFVPQPNQALSMQVSNPWMEIPTAQPQQQMQQTETDSAFAGLDPLAGFGTEMTPQLVPPAQTIPSFGTEPASMANPFDSPPPSNNGSQKQQQPIGFEDSLF
jgi:hypothetical protein